MPSNPLNNRAQFIEWCLRKLGKPVLEIEVAPAQLEDRVDEAISYWNDYYFEGSKRCYLKYQLTTQDLANRYIPVENTDRILAITQLLTGQLNDSSSDLWSVNYQFRLQEFWNFNNISMIHYNMVMQQIDLLDFMLNVKWNYTFSRYENKIYIDWDWTTFPQVGQWIVFETTVALNPDTTNIYGDRWLKEYTTQLIKQQWAMNLRKFNNIQLPGATILDAEKMLDECTEAINILQERLRSGEEGQPLGFLIG